MTLKRYLFLMFLGTIIAWLAWLMVITYLDPETVGALSFLFFYLSLCMAVIGTSTLVGFGFRRLMHHDDIVFRQVSVSFRQGILLGLVIVLSLLLQEQSLLTWWNLIILIFVFTIVEFFFLSVRRAPPLS